ncbi:MAG TPA: hypothetical protein VGB24_06455 [Longimicrobium sp.]|jgi:hypothetical protein
MEELMRRFLNAGLAALFGVTLVVTPVLAAGEDTGCGRCYDNADASAHVFGHSWFGSYWYMDCAAFNSCHTNSQYGSCTGNHWSCGLGSLMLLDAVGKLAERGDRQGVEALVARYPSVMGFDKYGAAIVTDCNGRPMTRRPISIAA